MSIPFVFGCGNSGFRQNRPNGSPVELRKRD
jgi:hypothetical protein